MELKAKEFGEFRSLVYEKSGIALGAGKEALVGARIGKRMRALGIDEFSDYLGRLKDGDGGDELVHMLDAISTNVTSFFRESAHFDFLQERVTAWRDAGQRRFRFWSAACSSGEEPYTLAMTLFESGIPFDCDVRILATDLSTRVLEAAKEGAYPRAKLADLPLGFGQAYFEPAREGDSGRSRVRRDLRDLVTFRRLNLSSPPFPMKGPMDAIFVRNVMIYFDDQVRRNLLKECARLLKPGGILMVGHAESLTGILTGFKCAKPSIYVKQDA